MSGSGHKCPGPDCDAEVPYEMLACSRHWYQVPRAIRAAVWRAWADGAGAGTEAHSAAIVAAIARMRPLAARP
jgi:hypothetical protein